MLTIATLGHLERLCVVRVCVCVCVCACACDSIQLCIYRNKHKQCGVCTLVTEMWCGVGDGGS